MYMYTYSTCYMYMHDKEKDPPLLERESAVHKARQATVELTI